jgi:hypothetical protein
MVGDNFPAIDAKRVRLEPRPPMVRKVGGIMVAMDVPRESKYQ